MRNGFTLVELAIVIVIIALIVVGVMVGQELVKQSQYKSVIKQMNQYSAAAATFKAKYGQLSGDFTQGVTYNMNRVGMEATGAVNAARPTGGGNGGDGDGMLDDRADTTLSFDGEIANFWIYMVNASMLEGYTQVANCRKGSTNCSGVAGANFPAASVGVGILAVSSKNKLYYILGTGGFGSANDMDAVDDSFSAAASATSAVGRSLTAEAAYNIDGKVDDGDALKGTTTAVNQYGSPDHTFTAEVSGDGTTCFTTSGSDNIYNFASASNHVCSLAVLAGAQ